MSWTIEELKKKIEAEEEQWQERQQAMMRQFDMEAGAYQGRVALYREMLAELETVAGEEKSPNGTPPEDGTQKNDDVVAEAVAVAEGQKTAENGVEGP